MTIGFKSKAQQEATAVWNKCGRSIPVPIADIIDRCGVTCQSAQLDESISGMMVTREDETVVIVVNQNDPETRQRFTMAHELGHYLLHRESRPIFVDGKQKFYRDAEAATGTKPQEIEANAFAAELLMPEEKIKELIPQKLGLVEEEELVKLAEMFNVSQLALTIRLSRLNLIES